MTNEPSSNLAAGSPSASTPLSVAAVLSLVGALLLFVLHMTVRLMGAGSAWESSEGNIGLPFVVGILGLASVVPIVVGIAVGHIAIAATKLGKKRGRLAGTVGLTLSYVLFVLYLNRLVVVVLVAFQSGDWSVFVENFFWWA